MGVSDFSNPGGKIEIILIDHPNKIECRVCDQGRGIPENKLVHIFDKYGKCHDDQSSAGGAGLGLFISNLIITGHKGAIWAENNPNQGATIAFQLPKTQRQPKKKIGQMLIDKGYITREQLELELQSQNQD